MTIAIKPKYIPLVQKPFCCNVTCLQMILYRRGFGLFDQEALAQFFDVKVGSEARKAFTVKLGTYTSTNLDEGLITIESADIVNRFFKKNKIALAAKAFRASEITDLKNFITSRLQKGDDLWMEYKSHAIHGQKLIHDSLIERIATLSGKTSVTIVDPQGMHKTRLAVPLAKIRTAISPEFGRETGFLVISNR